MPPLCSGQSVTQNRAAAALVKGCICVTGCPLERFTHILNFLSYRSAGVTLFRIVVTRIPRKAVTKRRRWDSVVRRWIQFAIRRAKAVHLRQHSVHLLPLTVRREASSARRFKTAIMAVLLAGVQQGAWRMFPRPLLLSGIGWSTDPVCEKWICRYASLPAVPTVFTMYRPIPEAPGPGGVFTYPSDRTALQSRFTRLSALFQRCYQLFQFGPLAFLLLDELPQRCNTAFFDSLTHCSI